MLYSELFYHGSNVPFREFEYKYLGKGTEQEGYGFYLTNTIDDARMYGKYIMVVRATVRKFVSTTRPPNHGDIRKMLIRAPNLEDTLTNFDTDRHVPAFENAYRLILTYNQTAHDAFQTVSYDFYRDEPEVYLKNMVSLGYDGVLIQKHGGVKHLIAFDPKKLKILDTKLINERRLKAPTPKKKRQNTKK